MIIIPIETYRSSCVYRVTQVVMVGYRPDLLYHDRLTCVPYVYIYTFYSFSILLVLKYSRATLLIINSVFICIFIFLCIHNVSVSSDVGSHTFSIFHLEVGADSISAVRLVVHGCSLLIGIRGTLS